MSRDEILNELKKLASLCQKEGINSKQLVKEGLEKLVQRLKEN